MKKQSKYRLRRRGKLKRCGDRKELTGRKRTRNLKSIGALKELAGREWTQRAPRAGFSVGFVEEVVVGGLGAAQGQVR